MNQGGEEAFDLPTVVGEEAASAVLPSRPPASIQRLFTWIEVMMIKVMMMINRSLYGQDFDDWFDAVLPQDDDDSDDEEVDCGDLFDAELSQDDDDSDDEEVVLVPENTLAGRPRLHRQILGVLKVYPDYRAVTALIKANASLDIIKEALYIYDDIKEKNKVSHPLAYAFLCCPNETILYIAERFPNTVNWNYTAMFHNRRFRRFYDSEPVSMETWKELFSIIVESGHPVRGIIENAFTYELSSPLLELLLEMTYPKIIRSISIGNGEMYCLRFVDGHLLGKLLPRIQRLTLEDEMHLTNEDQVAFWSSLPSQGRLKMLDIKVHIQQTSSDFCIVQGSYKNFSNVLKKSLSNNRSIEHLSLHFVYEDSRSCNADDFHTIFESIGDGVQNMPQLKFLQCTGEPVFTNNEYVMEILLKLLKGSTALGVSFNRKKTAAISLWEQVQFHNVLNQVGRGLVRSMDQSNAEFLDLLLKSQRRDDDMAPLNVVYGLLREKPSIWSSHTVK